MSRVQELDPVFLRSPTEEGVRDSIGLRLSTPEVILEKSSPGISEDVRCDPEVIKPRLSIFTLVYSPGTIEEDSCKIFLTLQSPNTIGLKFRL